MKTCMKTCIVNLLGYFVTIPGFVLVFLIATLEKISDIYESYVIIPYGKFLRKVFKI